MVVSRDKAPTAQETFMQMAQAAGLRGRLLVTIGLLILARFGVFLPVPGINREQFSADIQNSPFVGFLDLFSGGGLSALGIFALGILPYINASIILQLLTAAIPSLENLQKNEGEAGRRRISQITRYVALGWGVVQSLGIALWVQRYALEPGPLYWGNSDRLDGRFHVRDVAIGVDYRTRDRQWRFALNFCRYRCRSPRTLGQTIELAQTGGRETIGKVVLLLLVFLVMIVGIVFVQEGSRRIPIISARRQVGRRIYRERTNYLPLRLNQGGVMPIIFASAVLILPASLAQFTRGESTTGFLAPVSQALIQVSNYLSPNGPTPWLYVLVYLFLIVFFSYFYASLIVNPVDMSQNLKKMGASIPGIRPGRATSEYIERVLNRLTFLGAIFLGLVAVVPTAVESATGVTTFRGLGATSLLILVGVAIDTAKQIQTYVISQRYEGMVKQ